MTNRANIFFKPEASDFDIASLADCYKWSPSNAQSNHHVFVDYKERRVTIVNAEASDVKNILDNRLVDCVDYATL